MRNSLLTLGFKPEDIRMLADGVAGSIAEPKSSMILDQLDRVIATTNSGDRVVLYFAGHGARQPADAATVGSTSLDGFEAIFLPLDAGPWNQPVQAVANAITNHTLRDKVTALRARGAFVWVIVDSCNSQYMVRGNPTARVRGLSFSDLGIPPAVVSAASARVTSRGAATPAEPDAHFDFNATAAGGYVGFFAAQSTELTPEFIQPVEDPKALVHGLFTFNLVGALQMWPTAALGTIGDQILKQYSDHGRWEPTPSFAGDTFLAQSISGAVQSSTLPQWRVTVTAAREYSIAVGQIGNIGAGSIFAILANAADPTSAAIGYAEARNPFPDHTQLTPISYQNRPPLPAVRLTNSTARLIAPIVPFTLRVALPAAPSGTANQRHAFTAVQELARRENPHSQIIWHANATADTDVRLTLDSDNLWLLTGPAAQQRDLTRRVPSVAFADPQFGQQIHAKLNRISKALNLIRIANTLDDSGPAGFTLTATLKTSGGGPGRVLQPIDIPKVSDGDWIVLHFDNTTAQAVDVTVLYLTSEYKLNALFPRKDHYDINRLAPFTGKLDIKVLAHTVEAGAPSTLGLERVIIIATAALPEQQQSNFLFLTDDALDPTRGLHSSFERLLTQASFHLDQTRGGSYEGDEIANTRMRVISWNVETTRK